MKITATALCLLLFIMPACQESSDRSFSQQYSTVYLKRLLMLAKSAILEQFDKQCLKTFQEIPYSQSRLGVFIRIIGGSRDRGCIGFYRGVDSIEGAVRAAAVNAAFFDGRYPPLRREELAACELEITVIGKLDAMADPFDFNLTEHMLRIEFDHHEAMLQPQIASQYGYGKEAFLRALCRKAGLEENMYCDNGVQLYKARAIYLRKHWSEL
jgi:AmmeMemoRadiSam system protein A